jgi:hypothetical protein
VPAGTVAAAARLRVPVDERLPVSQPEGNSMRKTIIVPAELVSDVRVGLHSLIGVAAQELDRIVDLPEREQYPE